MEVTNLKAYLANIGMTITDFSRALDVNENYMSSLIHGHRIASRRLAKDIAEATDGVVVLPTKPRKQSKYHTQGQQDQNLGF